MPEEVVIAPELSEVEKKLAIIEEGEAPASPAEVSPKETEAPSPGEEAPSPLPSEELDKKLEAIEEEKPVEEVAGLTAEQKRILAVVPNAQAVEELKAITDSYVAFNSAFEKGKFDEVESLFDQWNPQAYEAFKDFLYRKHAVEWVDRWVQEQDTDPKNKAIRDLSKRQQEFEAREQQRQAADQSRQTEAQAQRQAQAYLKHIDGLFDSIDFAKGDRQWVASAIHAKAGADPAVAAQLRAGNFKAVNGVFKAVVREYVQRDKKAVEDAEVKTGEQERKKFIPPSPGVESAIPDDINQVPKDKLDAWEDAQIAKLLKQAKRK